MTVTPLTKADAAAALRSKAHQDSEGRVVVHCLLGIVGTDWELDEALRLVSKATHVAWADHPFRHHLAVVADGRQYNFDVERPGGGS
jgi:hypothetical protein